MNSDDLLNFSQSINLNWKCIIQFKFIILYDLALFNCYSNIYEFQQYWEMKTNKKKKEGNWNMNGYSFLYINSNKLNGWTLTFFFHYLQQQQNTNSYFTNGTWNHQNCRIFRIIPDCCTVQSNWMWKWNVTLPFLDSRPVVIEVTIELCP